VLRIFSMALVTAAILGIPGKSAADPQVDRGKYLVTVGGCNDCHTPGGLINPDMTRMLSGADLGFGIPGLGVFVGRNLTPDKETGLGNWTTEQIVTAFTTGVRPDGRILAPWMPWKAFSQLSSADAQAIAAYLKSIPAVKNPIPGPFGPEEKPSLPVFTVVPGDVYASMPKPPPPK
jgi:mono/diheme cytochrome c family protein